MDGYEVLEKLGSGSFGTIRRIVRKSDRKVLVWKEIRYGRMSEKEKSMLVSEVNILRELKHPNIVRYKDRIIDRETSTIYIIMEFCENGDLSSVIRKYKRSGKRMEESRIWALFFQLSCALHECHSRKLKILHRDIKPANVFIDRHQLFKLGDFGLARILSSDTQLAKTNVGTPYYMAPEQVNELPYNEKCDIWSMGCLLYEMAALAPPFEAANQLALAVKIKAGRVARLPEGYSDDLNSAVRAMLQLDAGKRPCIEDLFKLPRMQEQAELAVKGAQAVPPSYMDRYFGQQLRRLQAKEEEIAARAQELVTKEKNLRAGGAAGKAGGSGGAAAGEGEIAAREEEVRRKEEELRRKEEELRRKEDKLDADARARRDAAEEEVRAAAEARVRAREEALRAQEAAIKTQHDDLKARERSAVDKERKLDKAKAEYHVLYAELKRRKKALDDQQAMYAAARADAKTGGGKGGVRDGAPGGVEAVAAPASSHMVDVLSALGTRPMERVEGFARRHSDGGGALPRSVAVRSESPRRGGGDVEAFARAKSGETGGAAGEEVLPERAKLIRAQAAAAAVGTRAAVKPTNTLSAGTAGNGAQGGSEPRSPTPHPRHGWFVDRDGQERHMLTTNKMPAEEREAKQAAAGNALGQVPEDKENTHPQRRPVVTDAAVSKRHAIYGVLFGKRPANPAAPPAPDKGLAGREHAAGTAKHARPAAVEEDVSDDDGEMAPIRLNGRRMFAMPADGDADDSI